VSCLSITRSRLIRHCALRLLVALVDDVEHGRRRWLSEADVVAVLDSVDELLWGDLTLGGDGDGDVWDERMRMLQLFGHLLLGGIIEVRALLCLARVWSRWACGGQPLVGSVVLQHLASIVEHLCEAKNAQV
jgi:hypothetical protein